jgi:hypothetical protein
MLHVSAAGITLDKEVDARPSSVPLVRNLLASLTEF